MSELSPKSRFDKWAEKMRYELDDVFPKQFDPNKDLWLQFEKYYKSGHFFDFEIKSTSSEDTIKVHKLFLISNGFKNVEKCGSIIKIGGNKELIKTLIDGYYYRKFDLKLDSNNIEEYIEITDQFGNEELFDFLSKKKTEIDFFSNLNEMITSVKRKSIFSEITPKKRIKSYTRVKTPDKMAVKSIDSPQVANVSSDQPIEKESTLKSNDFNESNVSSIDLTSEEADNDINIDENGSNFIIDENGVNLVIDGSEKPDEDKQTESQQNIVPQTDVSVMNETQKKKKCLTTECVKFLPEEEEEESKSESNDISIIEESSASKGNSYSVSNCELKKFSAQCQTRPMDYTKLIKSLNNSSQKKSRSPVAPTPSQRDLRRSTRHPILKTDPKFKATFEPVIKYV